MSPACLLHVSYVRLWTHAGADFQTFRREDSAHHNSHLRALDSSQQLGERHDRFRVKHRGTNLTKTDSPSRKRARTHAHTLARTHDLAATPVPTQRPTRVRRHREETGYDLFRSALAPNSRLCWIAHSHAALLALTSPPERAPLRASRAGESAHQLSKRCDTLLCNLFLSSPTVDPAAVAAACHIVTCAGG